MRVVKMTWPELGVTIPFQLEDEVNKELCDEFWSNLPLVSIQEHGSVTGKIIYCWVNMLSFAPVHLAQLHTEAPVGRVSYSQGTGNKVIIKYGECSEDCAAPSLGLIAPEYHDLLADTAKKFWDNYAGEKFCYTVKFEKGE